MGTVQGFGGLFAIGLFVTEFSLASYLNSFDLRSISPMHHLQGKKEKKSKTPRVMPSPGPAYHEVGSDPMPSDRSNVADSSQMADDPPLDIVDVDDDSSDEENNLIDGANKLASAMMALLGGEGSDNASGGVGQQPSKPKRAAATTAAGGEGGSGAADPFDFSPIGGGGRS